MSGTVSIAASDGAFSPHVVRPAIRRAPVIIVLHEVFGVNDDMRETCHELASTGYLAICPDLFWRQEPALHLSTWNPAAWKNGLSIYSAYNLDMGVLDIEGAIAFARTINGGYGKVGLLGFCIGGLMTLLTAARKSIDAAVAYYPGATDKHLDEGEAIVAPMLVHLGEEDEFIPQFVQEDIQMKLAVNPCVTIHSYPARRHSFARHTGPHYHAVDTSIANGRTWAFSAKHLG